MAEFFIPFLLVWFIPEENYVSQTRNYGPPGLCCLIRLDIIDFLCIDKWLHTRSVHKNPVNNKADTSQAFSVLVTRVLSTLTWFVLPIPMEVGQPFSLTIITTSTHFQSATYHVSNSIDAI